MKDSWVFDVPLAIWIYCLLIVLAGVVIIVWGENNNDIPKVRLDRDDVESHLAKNMCEGQDGLFRVVLPDGHRFTLVCMRAEKG